MFARTVTVRLESHAVADFNRTLENEITPILRKQRGFQEELILVTPDGTEAVGISLLGQQTKRRGVPARCVPRGAKTLVEVD